MSEATEPEATAAAVPNDHPAQQEDTNGTVDTAGNKSEAPEETNGSAQVKEEENGEVKEAVKEEVKEEENGPNDNLKERKDRTYEDGVLKTSAECLPGENNSKYNPEVLPVSEDHDLIRAQVEFYFSDSNLPGDNHLYKLTDGTSNKPVPLTEICKFGRMRRFQPQSNVVAALRKSSFLVVSGSEGEERVNRKVPYDPTAPKSEATPRSVYVKGFGDEVSSTQFDIEAFFAPYGPVRCVRLRRTVDKLFKGSVFVEFEDEETADKFMKLDPKPLWKDTHALKIMTKQDYMTLKEQEIKDGKIEPQLQRNFRGRGRGRGRGGDHRNGDRRDNRDRGNGGDRDPDDWKKRREDDRSSGYKDKRRGGDRREGDRRGRGGRGGRGARRDDRGPKDRNKAVKSEETDDGKKPEVKSEATSEEAPANGKRAREDDGGAEEKPAKKVDVKLEVAAEA